MGVVCGRAACWVDEACVGATFVGFGVGGVLTRSFPPAVVDEVVTACGRTERRHRSLPALTMAYFVIGMALHSRARMRTCSGC